MPATLNAENAGSYVRAVTELTPNFKIYVEAVHRLSDSGVVVTETAHGSSHDGFDAEWHFIILLTIEGEQINRCEVFDEADLDAALARFEELQPRPPRPKTAARQVD